MQKALEAVLAVEAVRKAAQTRIHFETQLTFFSVQDEWMYVLNFSSKTGPCQTCKTNEKLESGMYRGNHLRAFFPYLEILDVNTIKVNEHPNCRCVLVRVMKTKEGYKKIIFKEE